MSESAPALRLARPLTRTMQSLCMHLRAEEVFGREALRRAVQQTIPNNKADDRVKLKAQALTPDPPAP